MQDKGFNKEGNHMVSDKGPYDGKEFCCPVCKSKNYTEARECPCCMETMPDLRCPKCGDKTAPVYVCPDCGNVWWD